MSETIFTVQTPSNGDAANGAAIVTATTVIPAVHGTVTHGRQFLPTSNAGGVEAVVYRLDSNSAGALVARQAYAGGNIIEGAWSQQSLSAAGNSALRVYAGQHYAAGSYYPGQHIVATSHLFDSGIVNGNLTAPADGTAGYSNGRFHSGGLGFPGDSFNSSGYFGDWLFDARTGTVENGVTTQTPDGAAADPGVQHLYGNVWTLASHGTLQATGNRVWWAGGTELGWAVYRVSTAEVVVAVDIDPTGLPEGWVDVPDLGQTYDLPTGDYVVYGRWVGNPPLLTGAYAGGDLAGSGDNITLAGGTSGLGALLDGPGAGTSADLAFADADVDFTGEPVPVEAALPLPVATTLTLTSVRVRTGTMALSSVSTLALAPIRVRRSQLALPVSVALSLIPTAERVVPGRVTAGSSTAAGIVASSASAAAIVAS
jgi:hypothetical protein